MADSSNMVPRLNTRLPIFELVMFLVAAALGWATFETHNALTDVDRLPVPVAGVKQVEEFYRPIPVPVPAQTTTTTTIIVESAKPQDLQEIMNLSSLLDMKHRYTDLADQLEPGLATLRDALQSFLRDKDRTEIGRYRRQGQAVEAWIRKQQDNVDLRKQQSLREWLVTLPASNALPVILNIDILLNTTQSAFSNYLHTMPIVEGQLLSPDLVQAKLNKAAEPEQTLLGVVRQAREKASAIDTFVKMRQTAATAAAPVVQALQTVQPVIAANATNTTPVLSSRTVRSIGGEGAAGAINAFLSLRGDARSYLQPLFYTLVATLIVQCILTIMAFHNRMVVVPLRAKLIEDGTAIEHQRKLGHFARLATGLAHEIRNPLTAINVRLFTLQKSLSKGTNEHGDASLIRNEIDRLEQILKNFLKLARPSEPKFAMLTAEPALREVQDLLAPQLQRHAVMMKQEGVVDTPFLADPLQLKQVLINLIQNAADSIGEKGSITLRARQGQSRLGGHSVKSVILEVEDTGSGMAPEVQERLFDPFFSTKESGTGLGLAIAAKIIDQHKGTLDFETRPGHGTKFRVILPASDQ